MTRWVNSVDVCGGRGVILKHLLQATTAQVFGDVPLRTHQHTVTRQSPTDGNLAIIGAERAAYFHGVHFFAVLKMPNVGAGMSGVAMYNLASQSGFLAESGDYADDLEALPMVLSENDAMYLSEAGNMYLAEDGMYLAENDLYPGYDYASFGVDI